MAARVKKRVKKTGIKKISKRIQLNKIPGKQFSRWLTAAMARQGIRLEKKRIIEYNHIYNRTRQLMPQMVDFVQTIFKRRKAGRLNSQLVFLGRGARPFYRIAYKLGPEMGVPTKSIKIVEAGRRLTGQIKDNPTTRKQLLAYLETRGINLKKSITFVDTGVIGTVPNDFIQLLKIERPKTKVNGFMFYGRNVRFEDVKQYAPSKTVNWRLPRLTEREARSVIEELPKAVLTIRELVEEGKRVKPKYVKSEVEEIVGSRVVKKAIMDSLQEIKER